MTARLPFPGSRRDGISWKSTRRVSRHGPRTSLSTLPPGRLTPRSRLPTLSEDVTVRANAIISSIGKTAAPLRDQPITVNRITADYIQSQGINDLVVALQSVGNVNSWNRSGVYEYYTFRGFSDSVQMVDGIRNEGNRVRTQLSNVESIEILKGPASVLYGSDALGGTVNIVLKKPSPQPAYDFSASLGSWKTLRSAFGATGRLGSDALLYRFDSGSDSPTTSATIPGTSSTPPRPCSWRLGPHDLFDFRYSLNRNSLSGDGGIPQVTRPDGSTFIPDVPRERRYNTPDDFALSYDQNIRSSYGHSFPTAFGVRNIFAGRLFDDEYLGGGELCGRLSQHGQPDVPVLQAQAAAVGEPGGVHRPVQGRRQPRPAGRLGLSGLLDAHHPRGCGVGGDDTDRSLQPGRDAPRCTRLPPTRYDYTDAITNAFYVQDQLTLTSKLKAVSASGSTTSTATRTTTRSPTAWKPPSPAVNRISNKSTSRSGLVYQPINQLDLYGQYATSFRPNFNLQPDGSTLEPEYGGQLRNRPAGAPVAGSGDASTRRSSGS